MFGNRTIEIYEKATEPCSFVVWFNYDGGDKTVEFHQGNEETYEQLRDHMMEYVDGLIKDYRLAHHKHLLKITLKWKSE